MTRIPFLIGASSCWSTSSGSIERRLERHFVMMLVRGPDQGWNSLSRTITFTVSRLMPSNSIAAVVSSESISPR